MIIKYILKAIWSDIEAYVKSFFKVFKRPNFYMQFFFIMIILFTAKYLIQTLVYDNHVQSDITIVMISATLYIIFYLWKVIKEGTEKGWRHIKKEEENKE